MKTKINSQVLDELLGTKNSRGISDFQKYLIQEGVKKFLFDEKCPHIITAYLRDVGVIEGDDDLSKWLSQAKDTTEFLKTLANEKVVEVDWDYNGLSNNSNFFGTQKDWNQTLITRINEISANIYKKTNAGGANLILASPDVSAIFDDLEYMHSEYEEFPGYCKLGDLGNRYLVLSPNFMSGEAKAIVIRVEKTEEKTVLDDKGIKFNEYHVKQGCYGVVNFKNIYTY